MNKAAMNNRVQAAMNIHVQIQVDYYFYNKNNNFIIISFYSKYPRVGLLDQEESVLLIL